MDHTDDSGPRSGPSLVWQWCMTVDEFNPVLHPGERVSRLPNGDYEVTDGTRQWRYTPDEWESLAGDAFVHMDSMTVLHHIRRGVAAGSLDRRDLLELIDDMERRLTAEYEIAAASWQLWLEARGHGAEPPQEPTTAEGDR